MRTNQRTKRLKLQTTTLRLLDPDKLKLVAAAGEQETQHCSGTNPRCSWGIDECGASVPQ